MPLAVQRVWGLSASVAARRGTRPRGSWAGPHETERDGSEQCPFRTTRRQLDADARNVFDHARSVAKLIISRTRAMGETHRIPL